MNNRTAELDGRILSLVPVLLEFPLSVVQRTHLPCFEPARDAVEVKSMVTDSPCNSALFRSSRRLVSLTFYAKIHNVVPADGTVINHNIPGPEGYCIPLFHFKALLARAAVGAARGIHIHRCRHFGNTRNKILKKKRRRRRGRKRRQNEIMKLRGELGDSRRPL